MGALQGRSLKYLGVSFDLMGIPLPPRHQLPFAALISFFSLDPVFQIGDRAKCSPRELRCGLCRLGNCGCSVKVCEPVKLFTSALQSCLTLELIVPLLSPSCPPLLFVILGVSSVNEGMSSEE